MVAAVWLAPAVAWATSWWWCQSIAASFVDFGDPGYGATLSSNNCPVLSACDDLDGDTTIIESAHPASSARRATGGASCPASKITMRGFGEGVHAGYELLLLLALGWRRQR